MCNTNKLWLDSNTKCIKERRAEVNILQVCAGIIKVKSAPVPGCLMLCRAYCFTVTVVMYSRVEQEKERLYQQSVQCKERLTKHKVSEYFIELRLFMPSVTCQEELPLFIYTGIICLSSAGHYVFTVWGHTMEGPVLSAGRDGPIQNDCVNITAHTGFRRGAVYLL